MDKYQEALDGLKENIGMRIETDEDFYGWIKTLQELVDKAKPKFVLCPKGFQGMRYTRYYCPNCKKSVRNDDECCHKCGQNIKFPKIKVTNNKVYLDWSDEDE